MNRTVFAEAMRAGADAAWDGDWEQAIAAYQRALEESPRDANALTALGLACFNADRLDAALDSYRRAAEVSPDNPVLLERIGATYERLGRPEEAADSYVASAGWYLKQLQGAAMALERWQDAVRVCPGHIQAHAQMLQHYHTNGKVDEALAECLALARIYQSHGQRDLAMQVYRFGLQLTPQNPELQAALNNAMQADQILDQGALSLQPAPVAQARISDELSLVSLSGIEGAEEHHSLVDIARRKALADLAQGIFDEEGADASAAVGTGLPATCRTSIAQGVDLQARGQVEDAAAAYEEALAAGCDQPALHFSLGLLYLELLRVSDARAQFEQACADDDYRLGSHFALGECHRVQGQAVAALGHLAAALQIVDLASVPAHQAEELAQVYASLATSSLGAPSPERARELTRTLVHFLGGEDLPKRVAQTRSRLDQLSGDGPVLSLFEMLAVPDPNPVLEAIAHAQDYAEQGMLYAALEECFHGIGRAPDHLPLHRQLAQILTKMGKGEDALAKLVTVADTYRVRGDTYQALTMYRHALGMAPMDTAVRGRLAALLGSTGRTDEALEQYMVLADSYYQMAQMEQACQIYEEALQLASHGDPARQWPTRILHEIADIHMQRLDWKGAARHYERIRDLTPEDERARLALMRIHQHLGRPDLAIAEMDGLLAVYRAAGNTERMMAVLEEAVHERPTDIALNTRLAQAYLNAAQVQRALVQLDHLADLQVEAGRDQEARATIQAIIALNPPNAAQYRQSLEQLSAGSAAAH